MQVYALAWRQGRERRGHGGGVGVVQCEACGWWPVVAMLLLLLLEQPGASAQGTGVCAAPVAAAVPALRGGGVMQV